LTRKRKKTEASKPTPNEAQPPPPVPPIKEGGQESTAQPPQDGPHESLAKRLKRIAWRATALYIWARLVLAVIIGDGLASRLGSSLVSHVISGLDRLGFTPVSPSHVALVLKLGWVLTIVECSPGQFIGLFCYLVSFPVWFWVLAIYGRFIKESRSESLQAARPSLRPKPRRRPYVAICVAGLLGWYLLFGEAPTNKTIWVAVVLSGILMVLLAYRAFRRATLMTDSDATLLLNFERQALAILNNAAKFTAECKEKLPSRSQAQGHMRTYKCWRWYFVTLAASLRGKRGKNLVSSIIVFYYALSLILLAASAVLFWAFTMKAISPSSVGFSNCLMTSVSHFLPGITPPVLPTVLPSWVAVGPGVTAWILLGVYVAASSSVLQTKMAAYNQRAETTYVCLRKTTVGIRALLSFLNVIQKRES